MKRFKRQNFSNEEVKRLNDNCAVSFDSILPFPMLSGIIIPNIIMLSGIDKIINHGLGVPYTGWFIIRQNAAASIYESSTVNTLQDLQIILKSSANVTVSLFIF